MAERGMRLLGFVDIGYDSFFILVFCLELHETLDLDVPLGADVHKGPNPI